MSINFLRSLRNKQTPLFRGDGVKAARQRRLRMEVLENRELLSVSTAEFAALRDAHADLALAEFDDYNIIEISADQLTAAKLKAAVEQAAQTKKDDLIVLRTTEKNHTLNLVGQTISIDYDAAAYGSMLLVGMGDDLLEILVDPTVASISVPRGELELIDLAFSGFQPETLVEDMSTFLTQGDANARIGFHDVSLRSDYDETLVADFSFDSVHDKVRALIQSNGTVDVRWTPVEGATGYSVYRRYKSGDTWTLLDDEIAASAVEMYRYNDEQAHAGYVEYAVYSLDVSEHWRLLDSVAITSKFGVPDVRVQELPSGTVYLTWNEVENATGYSVYRRRDEADPWDLMDENLSSETLSFTDKTLSMGYVEYAVYAARDTTWSKFNPVSLSVEYGIPLTTAAFGDNGGVRLNWERIPSAEGYEIYAKVGHAPYTKIAVLGAGTLSYVDESPSIGTVSYSVHAIKGGVYTNADQQIVETFPPPEASVSADETGKVTIQWKKVDDATIYQVFRRYEEGAAWEPVYTNIRPENYDDPDVYELFDTQAHAGTVQYSVFAGVDDGTIVRWSEYRSNVVLTLDFGPPDAGVSLDLSGNPLLSWNRVPDATGYAVYRRPTGEPNWTLLTDDIPADESANYSYTDTERPAGTQEYAVYAYNGGTWSDYLRGLSVE